MLLDDKSIAMKHLLKKRKRMLLLTDIFSKLKARMFTLLILHSLYIIHKILNIKNMFI